MRSAAHFRGHPIHPALIPFPFAFLYGAFFFDLAGRLADRPSWWTMGGYLGLVGIAAALIAAVPGFIDYFKTVPPKSSGKRRATQHMILNLSAVLLFVAAWAFRGQPQISPGTIILTLEGLGIGILTVGGWLGGVLVSRNQISVDHRYARAGRWNEENIQLTSEESVVVSQADELKVDQMKLLHLGGSRIVLARTEEGYVAFDDRCTHRGGSLAGGVMIGGVVQCPWHGSQFDCRRGTVRAGPAEKEIETHQVTEREGKVYLTVGKRPG